MKPTEHQAEILRYLSKVPEATKQSIGENVSFGYYCNGDKHFGAVLSRMVKSGFIERVKKGVYKFKRENSSREIEIEPKEQLKLF